MRAGRFLILVALLAGCTQRRTLGEHIDPKCEGDAHALTAVSGASVAETTQYLVDIYALVGVVPDPSRADAGPASIAELLKALTSVRDTMTSGQGTLAQALQQVDDLFDGPGALVDRATEVVEAGGSGGADYVALAAQVELLTDASGLSLEDTTDAVDALQVSSGLSLTATVDAVDALQTTSGSNGTLDDVVSIADALKACGGGASMSATRDALCPASLGGYAITSCPQGASGGSALTLVNKSGFTNFSDITGASNSSGIVTLVFNDGTAGQSYSIDTTPTGFNLGDGTGGTSPIAASSIVTLTQSSSGKEIRFANTSGGAITSAAQLTTALQNTFVNATMVAQNSCASIAALDAIVGGSSGTLQTRLTALRSQVNASPSTLTADIASAIASVKASSPALSTAISDVNTALGGSGTLAARASTLSTTIGASSPANVTTDLTSAITSIKSSSTVLATAISDVGATLGGSGALAARASGILLAIDGTIGFSANPSHSAVESTLSCPRYSAAPTALSLLGDVQGTMSDVAEVGSMDVGFRWSGPNPPSGFYQATITDTLPILNGALLPLFTDVTGNAIAMVNTTGASIEDRTSVARLVSRVFGDYPIGPRTCANPLAVTGVVPNTGASGGGTTVTIAGLGFSDVTAVYFGDTAASAFQVNDDLSVSATSPVGVAGTVDVTVVTARDASEATVGSQFTYQ